MYLEGDPFREKASETFLGMKLSAQEMQAGKSIQIVKSAGPELRGLINFSGRSIRLRRILITASLNRLVRDKYCDGLPIVEGLQAVELQDVERCDLTQERNTDNKVKMARQSRADGKDDFSMG